MAHIRPAAVVFGAVIAAVVGLAQLIDPNAAHGPSIAAIVVCSAAIVAGIIYLWMLPANAISAQRNWGWGFTAFAAVGLVISSFAAAGYRIHVENPGPTPTPSPTTSSPSRISSSTGTPPTGSGSSSTAPPAPPPGPIAAITSPGQNATVRGPDVTVSGIALNLTPEDELWVFDHDPAGGYTRDNDAPIPVSDGRWSLLDDGLEPGPLDLVLVRARGTCAKFIATIPPDSQDSHYVTALDKSCSPEKPIHITVN